MKLKGLILSLLILPLLWTSCKKEDPVIPVVEELITTLVYTLTPDGGGTATTFSFKDLDADGPDAPEVTGGTLTANTTYRGAITLTNEVASPAEDITAEVQTEDLAHQFFFKTTIAGLTIAYDDVDSQNNPLGLKTTLTTGEVGQGTIGIVLRHTPDKSASGVSDGDITNAGGETDIEVSFDINVE